jgi:TolB-like protein/Tfp pilus assembly protein PilF
MTDGPKRYQLLFAELKRRHVFKVAVVYGAVAFGVLEAADIVFPRIGLPEWTVTLVVALAAIGLPIAIVLAWAFETTPAGVKRTDPAASGELEAIVALPAGRRWPIGIFAAVAVLLLSTSVWWALRDGGAPAAEIADPMLAQSVAVLPFVDLSGGENEYLGDGMAETLINALTRIQGLQVSARTSAFAFKGKNEDVRVIGEQLGVGAVLEGSVQRAGERIRITAQLINTADGFHLWSENFDRDVSDVFAVQDEVARAVVEALQVELLERSGGPIVEQGTRSLVAYNAYLKGRFYWNKRTGQDLIRAATYFEEAITADSGYALAWSGLADSYSLFVPSEYNVTMIPWQEALRRAEDAARQALALDDNLAEAHTSLAAILEKQHEWEEAGEEYRRALASNPRYPTARQWYGTYLLSIGRAEEALAQLKRAEELDPLSMVISVEVGELLDALGRTDEATAHFEKLIAAHPGAELVVYYAFLHYLPLGDYERVSQLAATAMEHNILWAAVITPDEARQLAGPTQDPALRRESLIALAESTVRGELAIAIYRGLGEEELALAALERVTSDSLAVAQYLPSIFMTLGPELAQHPRAQAALVRLRS